MNLEADWSDASTSQETPRIASCHQKLEEDKEGPSRKAFRESMVLDTLILNF